MWYARAGPAHERIVPGAPDPEHRVHAGLGERDQLVLLRNGKLHVRVDVDDPRPARVAVPGYACAAPEQFLAAKTDP
jgi:hypothetical protein